VPNSHLRTVPTAVPMNDANSRWDKPSFSRASRASVRCGTTRWTTAFVRFPAAWPRQSATAVAEPGCASPHLVRGRAAAGGPW
jgi:hypothetical protein